jgi:hypothetical protein
LAIQETLLASSPYESDQRDYEHGGQKDKSLLYNRKTPGKKIPVSLITQSEIGLNFSVYLRKHRKIAPANSLFIG